MSPAAKRAMSQRPKSAEPGSPLLRRALSPDRLHPRSAEKNLGISPLCNSTGSGSSSNGTQSTQHQVPKVTVISPPRVTIVSNPPETPGPPREEETKQFMQEETVDLRQPKSWPAESAEEQQQEETSILCEEVGMLAAAAAASNELRRRRSPTMKDLPSQSQKQEDRAPLL